MTPRHLTSLADRSGDAMRFLVIITLLACSPAVAQVRYRQFSDAAAIASSADMFSREIENAAAIYMARIPGQPPIPEQFHADIVEAVSAGARDEGFDAAYISGSELNRSWGFLFNSGVPLGPTFEQFAGYLYPRGLELVQRAIEWRGVVAFPIGASSEQLSGYFAEPIGNVPGRLGIGLAGLCQQPWTLRYLPPAEDVLGLACDQLVQSHKIHKRELRFVRATPGRGSLVDAVFNGQLNGFEFATPADDVSQLFGPRTPVSVGLRYVHTPGWHQPFLLTWMIVNRGVWDSWTPGQRTIFALTSRANVLASWSANLARQGPALAAILDNGSILSRWPDRDLDVLKQVANNWLVTHDVATEDKSDYIEIVGELMRYVRQNEAYWKTSKARQ